MALEESQTSRKCTDLENGRLAGIVDELLEKARAGSPVDIDGVAAENPEFAAELRDLWAVVALAEEFGSESGVPLNERERGSAENSAELDRIAAPHQVIGDYELFEELGRGG